MFEIDEEEHKREVSFAYHGGSAQTLEDLADIAKRKAGAFYSEQQDVKANFWREVAIWLGEQSCQCRHRQKKYEKIFKGGGV